MARILVIDDETSIRELLCAMLIQEGYAVVESADGKVGMKPFRESPCDSRSDKELDAGSGSEHGR